VIAVRYDGGVVMVGDRQATSNYIANRDVRKVEAADRYTAIAISGSAARGIEFIRMAQLSFEHYEKMTDSALSLEGKANYLSPIIQRNNLTLATTRAAPARRLGPRNQQVGRIFEYDGAGGCYERTDFSTIGSGTPFAEGALRLGFSDRHRPKTRSNSARSRCTRRATTTRAPGARISCARSLPDDGDHLQ
jgi:proteasome beta subunit